jgi:hypothetical protein
MSKKENKYVKRPLAREELKNVTGGAPSLSDLSNFQIKRPDHVTNPPRDYFNVDTTNIDSDLLNGFAQPEVRPGNDFQQVDPDWVSDSISVQVYCIGWSKDYTDPPPDPQPEDPDGGTGGGGGGGGTPPAPPPGDPDGGVDGRFGGFDFDVDGLDERLERFGSGAGGLNRG